MSALLRSFFWRLSAICVRREREREKERGRERERGEERGRERRRERGREGKTKLISSSVFL